MVRVYYKNVTLPQDLAWSVLSEKKTAMKRSQDHSDQFCRVAYGTHCNKVQDPYSHYCVIRVQPGKAMDVE